MAKFWQWSPILHMAFLLVSTATPQNFALNVDNPARYTGYFRVPITAYFLGIITAGGNKSFFALQKELVMTPRGIHFKVALSQYVVDFKKLQI